MTERATYRGPLRRWPFRTRGVGESPRRPHVREAGCTLGNVSLALCAADRTLKEYFRPLDGEEVLRRIALMPIQTWSFQSEGPSVRHAGPAAQDFYAAFGLGTDDKSIGLTDINGIALRAVQALEGRTQQIPALNARTASLETD